MVSLLQKQAAPDWHISRPAVTPHISEGDRGIATPGPPGHTPNNGFQRTAAARMADFDFLIIGSGIAGASTAAVLAGHARVALFERESVHGYHTTGRSAALWSALYGNDPIRALTVASRAFYDSPPAGFAEHRLLSPRGCLYFAGAGQLGRLDQIADGADALGIATRRLSAEESVRLCPVLILDHIAGGLHEPDAMDIDVNALHQGFLRLCRAEGGDVRTDAEVVSLRHDGAGWVAGLASGETVTARVVVNAAGAWADALAGLAGVDGVGLRPLKRTAFLLDEPPGVSAKDWPATIEADEAFYFKPESGRILVSPCDETPSAPCDAWPEDLDIAECVERLQGAADIPVRRIIRSWAGLRSFVADRTPVIGFEPTAPGFFWLAGQGGYGVQTAPAAGRVAASLALGEALPGDVRALGLRAEQLSPARFRA
jgi:D-arginine dehydrogenase